MRPSHALVGLVCALGLVRSAYSAEYKFTIDQPPAGLTRAQFELWLPDSVDASHPVRGVICSPLYQADTRIYELDSWRALAHKHRLAMLRHDMRTDALDRPNRLPVGADALAGIDAALAHFAEKSQQPALVGAPLVITGLSQGGSQTTRLTALAPHRVIAAVPFHGGALSEITGDSPARMVPMLIVLGSKDDLTPRVMLDVPALMKGRQLWAVLMQPNIPHQDLGNQEFILTWLAAMVQARLDDASPGKLRELDHQAGFFGRIDFNRRFLVTSAAVKPVTAAPADQQAGHWLATKELADAWIVANRTGFVEHLESHEEIAAQATTAPAGVQIDGKLDEWSELPIELDWPMQVLPSGKFWRGPTDSSARFAVTHDENFVYFAFRVRDDEPVHLGKAPWHQDGLEVRIDARPAIDRMSNTGRGEGETFLLIAVGPGPLGLFVNGRDALPKGTQVAGNVVADGYSVEIAIPASYFDTAQRAPWTRFRLNVAVSDFDKDGMSQQWWRADWRTEMVEIGSGTVQRRE